MEAVVQEGLGGRLFPKAWGRHVAGLSEVQGGPGSSPDCLAWICAQQPWAEMGDLQSMGRDGAGELRGVVLGPGVEEAKPRTVPVSAEEGPVPGHWAANPV